MTDVVEDLARRIAASGVGTSEAINPFWRAQLQRLDAVFKDGAEVTPQRIQHALGYNQARLPKGVVSNRDLPHWPDLIRAAKTGDVAGIGKGVEHAASLNFLIRDGSLDEYLALADDLRVMSDIGLIRLFWYARRLAGVLTGAGRSGPQNFLEIGSGSGRFATLMVRQGLVGHYVMVDLPEMLLNAMLMARTIPGVELRFGEVPDFDRPGKVFWFLDTNDIAKAPSSSVDVAVNFNSFMEMDAEVRDFYIDQIYRTAGPEALFYNVNRRQIRMTRRDGSSFDSNPLLYPYRSTDRIIEWEPDECQQSCRSWVLRTPTSFTISRIAELQGD